MLCESDLFVLASTQARDGDRDGIPVSIVEAMAAGLPVVSTLVPGVREAVPEGAGILVPPDEPGQLAAAIDSLLALPESVRRAIGETGRAVAREQFDLESCADRLVSAIGL
jgi:colanic acid/amylovoran biosynthesis glycosyltransferase